MINQDALRGLDKLRGELSRLRNARDAKNAERSELGSRIAAVTAAPPDRAAVAELLTAAIDKTVTLATPPFDAAIIQLQTTQSPDYTVAAVADGWRHSIASGRALIDTPFLAFLAPALKAGIGPTLAAQDWPEGALSNEERARRLAVLEPQLATLTSELMALNSAIESLSL